MIGGPPSTPDSWERPATSPVTLSRRLAGPGSFTDKGGGKHQHEKSHSSRIPLLMQD